MKNKQYVWFDGRFVDFDKANVHILTHTLNYGSGVFEGIRAYHSEKGTAIFRLKDHMKRLVNSARICNMDIGYSVKELEDAAVKLVKKNNLQSCYIRPIAFYNDAGIGLSVEGKKVSVAIAALPFGNYFANKDKGIRCKVSSWRRINSDIVPVFAKATGNYFNSILASIEAKKNGADEAILLSGNGYVAEGPGENIFFIENSEVVTPSKDSEILLGITRDSVIKIAETIGITVEERKVHRDELYTADELFFTGTAAEVTPIVSIDSRKVGAGAMGPMTKIISDGFTDVVNGKNQEFSEWLTFV